MDLKPNQIDLNANLIEMTRFQMDLIWCLIDLETKLISLNTYLIDMACYQIDLTWNLIDISGYQIDLTWNLIDMEACLIDLKVILNDLETDRVKINLCQTGISHYISIYKTTLKSSCFYNKIGYTSTWTFTQELLPTQCTHTQHANY